MADELSAKAVEKRKDRDERGETALQQLDRNWIELLQELRVTQTGVQLLTAFLLSLPFQQRFTHLTHTQVVIYLTAVMLSITATGLLLAPVSIHRFVFRLHERRELVKEAGYLAQGGIGVLALAITAVVTLVFDVTESDAVGYTVGALTFLALGLLWLVIPLRLRRRARRLNPDEMNE